MIAYGRESARGPETELLSIDRGRITPRAILPVTKSTLERTGVEGEITPSQYRAWASVNRLGQVTLSVCTDPRALEIDPGEYRGTVTISGRGVEPLTLPVTVTIQYPYWPLLFFPFLFGVLLFAPIVVWLGGEPSEIPRIPALSRRGRGADWDLRGWARETVFPLVTGGIAAFGAFFATYWRDPAWGAEAPEQWIALFAAMFTAATAGIAGSGVVREAQARSAARRARRDRRRRRKAQT
ncbi:MAG TPA: hypothetical protein VHL78_10115 [Actinomycetota bacterium]|nr:hypothetical protein [Actinomycetota bacterium]